MCEDFFIQIKTISADIVCILKIMKAKYTSSKKSLPNAVFEV